jgi:GT2 family glycosyltransferase
MTPTPLDIVILSFNTVPDLDRCLASIVSHPPAGLDRVFVVDNASSDGSPEMVRARYPAVDLIALNHNVGFGAANNLAIAQSTSPLVLLLNSDTIVPADAIDRLVSRLQATGAAAIGPRLVDEHGRPEVSFGPMLSPIGELRQQWRVRAASRDTARGRRYRARLLGRERTVDWVSGACLLLVRQAALDAGLFDERYFLYEEDVDLCAAIRARGGRVVFTPAAEVLHRRGQSSRAAGVRPSVHYDRSHVLFYEKHRPAWAPVLRLWLRLRGRSIQ